MSRLCAFIYPTSATHYCHHMAQSGSACTRKFYREKRLPMCKCTFRSISFCYHGESVHRSTCQLHVIQVNPAVVTCQHTILPR